MDKYLLPLFFAKIKPTIMYTNKNQPMQINLVYKSLKPVFFKKSSFFLPVDITAKQLTNNKILISSIFRGSKSSTIILNISNTSQINFFNNNFGLLWPLRELFEFFNTKTPNMIDNRNLLLDYSSNINPLLKSFPCEGVEEVYFNFLNQKIKKFNIFFIEL